MTTSTPLRIVDLGRARALTRDGLDGPFLEMGVIKSRTPAG